MKLKPNSNRHISSAPEYGDEAQGLPQNDYQKDSFDKLSTPVGSTTLVPTSSPSLFALERRL